MKTIIMGNTYPHRFAIKELGAKWNKNDKSWVIPSAITPEQQEKLESLRGLIIEVSYGESSERIDTRSFKQIYGRCEDAPCCGCCGPQFY